MSAVVHQSGILLADSSLERPLVYRGLLDRLVTLHRVKGILTVPLVPRILQILLRLRLSLQKVEVCAIEGRVVVLRVMLFMTLDVLLPESLCKPCVMDQ